MKYLLLLMLASSVAFGRSEGGNEGGHGGDPYALEFSAIASGLAKKLAVEETRSAVGFQKWNFKAADFARVAKSTRYVSEDPEGMLLRGQEVDAINFPSEGMVKINRARWREGSLLTRTQLVLHELFGILGVERDSFEASLDFKTFLLNASKELGVELAGSTLVNIFYGQCLSFPSLSESSTCDSGSDKLAKAQICATNQAESKCRLGGKSQCELLNTSYTARMSSTAFGLRYCEVLVLMK